MDTDTATAKDTDECEVHSTEAPSHNTDLQAGLPPRAPSTLGKRKSTRLSSYVWDHFTLSGSRDDPDVRCKCNYCGIDYACGSKKCGTSTLGNHLTNNCKKYPGRLVDKKQRILSFDSTKEGGGSNLIAIGRSKEDYRVACAQYLHYFWEDNGGRNRGGPPSSLDQENRSVFVKFLKNFFNVTLTFSDSLRVSACAYFHEICNLVMELDEWRLSSNILLGEMATNMKKKFEKYWGKMENVNQLLLFATILDPRYKMDYFEYYFSDLYRDGEVVSIMMKSLKVNLMHIYEWYVAHEGVHGSSQISIDKSLSSFNIDNDSSFSMSDTRLSRFMKKQAVKDCTEIKNDVEIYLLDAHESVENTNFDVLDWWKVNKSKYGVLSNLAKDVLAIQVSTVASESAFSTGGRILDPFRSSLSPKMVEALICTQNWLRASPNLDGFHMEDVEHYNQLDEELKSINSKLNEDDEGQKS